jgi:hypothetical protein
MTGAAPHSATKPQRRRVEDFAREIGEGENDFPIPARRGGKRQPICIGGI